MKKILSTLTIVALMAPFTTFAEGGSAGGVCSIKQIPEDLQTYIRAFKKDFQGITTRIKKDRIKQVKAEKAKKKNQGLWEDIKDDYKDLGRITGLKLKRLGSTITDWSGFETDFDFWIGTGLDFTPSQVYRDHDLIETLSERVKSLIISMNETGADTKKIYEINGIKTSLSELYTQNEKLLTMFKENVVEKTVFADGKADSIFIYKSPFTNKEIKIDLSVYKTAFDSCEQKDYIAEISKIFKGGFDNIWDDWETAYRLMQGLDGDFENKEAEEEYRKIERELLKSELEKQGLSASQSELILKNLDNANTIGKNGEADWSHADRLKIISEGTYDETSILLRGLGGIVDEYKNFADKLDNSVDINNLTENSLDELIDYKIEIDRLTSEIGELYEKEKLTISKGTKASESIVQNVRDIHKKIEEALKTLDNAKNNAESVCKKQGSNKSKNCD